jgi:hypothetical protein
MGNCCCPQERQVHHDTDSQHQTEYRDNIRTNNANNKNQRAFQGQVNEKNKLTNHRLNNENLQN